MELQVGVKALLHNSEGKYLLTRRSPKKYPEIGPKWDIVGGRIEPGSPLFDNLKREIREEVGLELTDTPTLIAAQDILRVPGRHVVRLTYHASITGEPQADGEENTECGWFTIAQMKNMTEDELDIYLAEVLQQDLLKTVLEPATA